MHLQAGLGVTASFSGPKICWPINQRKVCDIEYIQYTHTKCLFDFIQQQTALNNLVSYLIRK